MNTEVKTILVGLDGSKDASRALEWAIALARQLEAEVVAVHAVGLLAHLGSGAAGPAQSHMEEVHRALLDDWCQPLTRSGVKHRIYCLDGPPVMALIEAAEREDVDLIVVGRRGGGGFPELLLGSTSHQLAEHSGRPVLVVPPAGSDRVSSRPLLATP